MMSLIIANGPHHRRMGYIRSINISQQKEKNMLMKKEVLLKAIRILTHLTLYIVHLVVHVIHNKHLSSSYTSSVSVYMHLEIASTSERKKGHECVHRHTDTYLSHFLVIKRLHFHLKYIKSESHDIWSLIYFKMHINCAVGIDAMHFFLSAVQRVLCCCFLFETTICEWGRQGKKKNQRKN